MKFLRYFMLLFVTVICGNVFSQSQRELGQLMRERGEYYFTLNVDDPSEIQTISDICSVDGTDGHTVVAYANQLEYDKLLQAGYQPNLQTPPSLREEAVMWQGGDRSTYEWNSYLSYGDYVSMMEGFPTSVTNGANCTLLDLGTLSTTNHRRILGVRLNNGQPDGKPKFLYTSTMHGDEVTGMILMLRLIDEFCTSTDSRIQNILDNVDLFIFPCTNPDGTYNGGNNTVTGAKRYNGNNVDLNRHFPDFDDGAHPDGASYYQDEAQWMMDLAQEYLFTMGANYHGGAEVMNYPWDTYQPVHPDDAWWRYVSAQYVSNARAVYSSYMTDTYSSGITNGYAWYTISGSRQDYMNYYGQCREVTIECSTDKTPSASQLPNFWNYNHNAMLTYIEECLNGVRGFVYDAVTGEPIEGVTVSVLDHDALGSSVSTHALGDFHRPIKGGTYTFEFKKSGYCTETMEVTVTDGQHVDLTVNLGQCAVTMNCYNPVNSIAAGSYVMGYIDGTTLYVLGQNSTNVTTISASVTPNENGFSAEDGTTIPQFTLTEYQNSGQYYIYYNGLYLARSNNWGTTLSWSQSQSSMGRWHIDGNGIYLTSSGGMGGNGNYYLYFDTNSNSFKLSTSVHNNITFYVEGDCPTSEFIITATAEPAEGGSIEGAGTFAQGEICTLTATAAEGYTFINWTENGEEVATETTYSFEVSADRELVANFEENITPMGQTVTLPSGWAWWSTYLDITLEQLEEALGTAGIGITSQGDGYVGNYSGTWAGSLQSISPSKMYKIQLAEEVTITLSGVPVDPADYPITLNYGSNWIGYPLTQSMSLSEAFAGANPVNGDVVSAYNGSSMYYNGEWYGNIQTLEPGCGYVYKSNDSESKAFTYPSNK